MVKCFFVTFPGSSMVEQEAVNFKVPGSNPGRGAIFCQGFRMADQYYCYILISSKSHIFYFGSAKDLKLRLHQHNSGLVGSTKSHIPWKLVWYGSFSTLKEAKDFELYLKTGSGKAFAYKRLVSEALKKDFSSGRKSSPKYNIA